MPNHHRSTTHIDKLRRQLTRGKKPPTKTRMTSCANMKHPNDQLPEINNGPFANKQNTPNGSAGISANMPSLGYPPNMHHNSMEWAPD